MGKKVFLFSFILSVVITLNCNIVYAEPNKINKDSSESKIDLYKTLEELKKELKQERREIDQQRLEEIKKNEEEKKKNIGENENNNEAKDNKDESKKNEVRNNKENDFIPSLIVRLRGKHSTKYLCSYNFILSNDNGESELDKTIYNDYKVLLKKTSLKVRAGEMINFEFSEKPTKIRAYIWGEENEELEINKGTIKVPKLDKKIVLGIEGIYKNGKVVYAVILDIRG